MALSDSKLKSLLNKKQSKRFDIADRDSLSVRVSEFGTITFQYRYRYHDKPSRIALGRYPDISLKQARDKVPELRQLLNDGFNPAVQTKRSKAAQNATLDECIDLFMEKHVTTLREVSQGNYKSTLVLHGKKAFKFPVEEVTIQEWFELFDRISENHSAITARALLVKIKTCLRFCVTRGTIENSCIFNIAPKSVGRKSDPKDRVPDLDEIKEIWGGINKSKCNPTTRNALKLVILTGARISEVRLMEERDLNLKKGVWVVPKEKSKTNCKITRPLAPEALKIIKWQIDNFGDVADYIFPSGSYKKEISTQTMNKLCRLVRTRLKMESWTAHDFRRSLSTLLSRKNIKLEVTETMLGHSLGGIIRNYNYHDWVPEQRDAYKLWEKLILE